MKRGRKPAFYTVYLRKNDELICAGTAAECAAAMGRSLADFYTLCYRVRKGEYKKWEIYCDHDDEDEEE